MTLKAYKRPLSAGPKPAANHGKAPRRRIARKPAVIIKDMDAGNGKPTEEALQAAPAEATIPLQPTFPPMDPPPAEPLLPAHMSPGRRQAILKEYQAAMAARRPEIERRLNTILPYDPELPMHVVERAVRYFMGMKPFEGRDIEHVFQYAVELYPTCRPFIVGPLNLARQLANPSKVQAGICPLCNQRVMPQDPHGRAVPGTCIRLHGGEQHALLERIKRAFNLDPSQPPAMLSITPGTGRLQPGTRATV